ncbi:MAG TPA: hypothetical protein VNZ22_03065, partial [Bacillota bacterium]|nr:hypothetical protein [Bacillota bacterium]
MKSSRLNTRGLASLASLLFSLSLAPATDCFVSPSGKDTNPGTRSQPFGSFQRAQQAVREARKAQPQAGVTVTFSAGRYELSAPLEFTPADSGASAQQPVVYRAQPGAAVVFSGGRTITGWQPDPQHPGLWKTRVAEPKPGDDFSWRFEQLWVNDQRAVRARTPNFWEFDLPLGITEKPAAASSSKMQHAFTIKPTALATLRGLDPAALHDVQMIAFHKWDTTREWLQSVDPEAGAFTTTGSKMQSWNPMSRESLIYFENYLAALDAPGEWFLDRDGWLYYQPRAGEDMKRVEVTAPILERFLVVHGTIGNANAWVRHVRFEGLKFRDAGFRVPAEGLPPGQAAMNIDRTAVLLDGASDIHFSNCAVEHIDMTAFWFRQACRECVV